MLKGSGENTTPLPPILRVNMYYCFPAVDLSPVYATSIHIGDYDITVITLYILRGMCCRKTWS